MHLSLKALLFAAIFLSQFNLSGQNYTDSLDLVLTEVAKSESLTGFSVCIIRDQEVKYSKGFGLADEKSGRKYTTQTIQNIASISKTFIGVSLMKAQEMNLLNLDDPIEKYLPYKIINPKFPNNKITIRHLATHTSSLKDPEDYERAYIFEEKIVLEKEVKLKGLDKMIELYNSNVRVGLDDFIKSIFHVDGKYYSKKNFLKKAPGEKFSYSNIGAGMAARIIELASGMSFSAFTQKHIFDPLEMNNSTWELAKADRSMKATGYLVPGVPLPHYELITFADGGLITSIDDLGKFALEMMNCYAGKGTILSEVQAKEMMTPYLKDAKEKYGIFWAISSSGLSRGHSGGDPGTMTQMYFQPKTGIAKVMFMNCPPIDKSSGEAINRAWKTMKKFEKLVE